MLFRSPEVLAAIAMRVQTNIRELEGALTRSVAYATLNGKASVVATTNTVAHPSNAVDLTEPIAGAINSLLERQPNA